jgi:hypothetical protein
VKQSQTEQAGAFPARRETPDPKSSEIGRETAPASSEQYGKVALLRHKPGRMPNLCRNLCNFGPSPRLPKVASLLGFRRTYDAVVVEKRTQALHVLDKEACCRYRHTQVDIFDLVLFEVKSACGF